MYLSVLIYIIAVLATAFMFYFWGENLYLKQKIAKLEEDTRTKFDLLVEARKNIMEVDIKNDLNIDQTELWTNFVKLYYKEIIENE